MVPCCRLIYKKVLSKHDNSPSWKSRKCAKKSTRFFRVDYSELVHWRRREDKKYDVFAMCESCAAEAALKGKKFWFPPKLTAHYGTGNSLKGLFASNQSGWSVDRSPVHGLRGTIKSFEEIQGVESTFRNDVKERKISVVKSYVQRIMSQDGNKGLTPDDWERIFKDCHEEFIVASVLCS